MSNIYIIYWKALHKKYRHTVSSSIYQLQTISTTVLFLELARCVICSDLQFQAEEHSEEDKTEAEEADGQADQPSEQGSLPGWVVELLTACYGTAALHTLQRQQQKRREMERVLQTHFFP